MKKETRLRREMVEGVSFAGDFNGIRRDGANVIKYFSQNQRGSFAIRCVATPAVFHYIFVVKEKLKKIGSAVYGIWMKFAGLVAFVNTRVLLTVVYFIVIGPLHLLMRLMGKDYLDRRHDPSPTFWKKKEPVTHSLESARRQF